MSYDEYILCCSDSDEDVKDIPVRALAPLRGVGGACGYGGDIQRALSELVEM